MPARTNISFASCNLYNLQIPEKSMYRGSKWTKAQYDKKVSFLAVKLREVDSIFWGFQELWSKQGLTDIFKAAKLTSKYKLLTPPGHKGNSIVCAGAVDKTMLVGEPQWISKFPDKFKLQSKGDDPQTADISVNLDSFSRPVLHFQVRPRAGGKVIHVFVAHLKSKLPTPVYKESWYNSNKAYYTKHSEALGSALATIRRTAEAAALRMIISDVTKGSETPVVVLGDLNDAQLSNTLNIITGQPNYLMAGQNRKGGSDTDLYSVANLQEYRSLRDVYYTHIHQDVKESLDHILVSQEFFDNSKKRIWAFDEMRIFNDHLNDEDHKGLGTLDHGIVRASFEYRPVPKAAKKKTTKKKVKN